MSTLRHTSQYQCLLRMLQLRHELILSMYPASGLLEFDELGDENFINALVSAFMDGNRWHRSTKVDKMVEILRYTRIHHPDDKTIVFSQWIMLLDICEKTLMDEGFNIARVSVVSFVNLEINRDGVIPVDHFRSQTMSHTNQVRRRDEHRRENAGSEKIQKQLSHLTRLYPKCRSGIEPHLRKPVRR
ncbi:hypothetical protein BC936DRAFT_139162 [Jimgerdemannia flammicorona]|uniref:Uncharacterized protein n=1 Tax=Jimgerdemannia flammicorona TaxID=994334 RepID=A0A433BAN7_9FUNG|nr:hypothetical protein BC936DRAFT_139162 [Jimgerdemannia flammicorona]